MTTAAALTETMNTPLTEAVDLTWRRKDTGAPWLVVERGTRLVGDGSQRLHVAHVGRIVGTYATEIGAKRAATRLRNTHHARGRYARIDVVARDTITITQSDAPYGCMAAEG